jgi:hypothetical protein
MNSGTWETVDVSEFEAADSSELHRLRAERDALRQELADLRAGLSVTLGILKRTPGPQGLTVLNAASDREIYAKIEALISDADR